MSGDNNLANTDSSVRATVRIRPQHAREIIDICRICTTVTPNEPQIVLGIDKAFTFDNVFDISSTQAEIYNTCVQHLVEGALKGYNATVLAYGQTGSGKTYTMGTGFDCDIFENQQGIIPRAVRHIFASIEEMQSPSVLGNNVGNVQFSVAIQFMELYNEDIIDLLDPYSKGKVFKIHEDGNGEISVSGVTIKPVNGPQDTLKYLQRGALARTTASTQMNEQSSRSHALFTLLIRRQSLITSEREGCDHNDMETLTSKFHFVDLAGSERLKRTGATGERAREGIAINSGLLSLGNCISALGDKSKKCTHVPYRDSKLTRLLQDSLGGNSQTLMIACISPSDRDFMETLNTLKYANRARNIKNRIQLNQDQSSRTISQLRREIAALQIELLEYKQGKRIAAPEGNSSFSDTFHENSMLLSENKRLQHRIKALQETVTVLTEKNSQLSLEKQVQSWSSLSVEDTENCVSNVISSYLNEIEQLRAKLIESEEMYQQLRKGITTNATNNKHNIQHIEGSDIIQLAKRELERDREMLMFRSLPGAVHDDNSNAIVDQSDSDESDVEYKDNATEIQADLIDVNSDIEIKSKLIEQLELSQQRMQLMRQHYEEKLNVLSSKIQNTQKERDAVLQNMCGTGQSVPLTDKMKKVREEYERKITDLQSEVKKLSHAQREHLRQQHELRLQEAKLQNLRVELTDLKCHKANLVRKISDQTSRHREEESRKAKEIATLRKEQRRQQNTVRSLQAQMQAKDQILKRKTEEVSALRRSQRGSRSGRYVRSTSKPLSENTTSMIYSNTFNSRNARKKWQNLFRAIGRAARNKQAVTQFEVELDRLMQERENLSSELNTIQSRQSLSESVELANEEDTIRSSLDYLQDNISHIQQSIMELEEGGRTAHLESQNVHTLINNVRTVDEAKFLLERLTDSAIMFSCNSGLTENRLLENETILKGIKQERSVQQQLIQHFLSQNDPSQIATLFESLNLEASNLKSNNLSGSRESMNSNMTYDIPNDNMQNILSQHNIELRLSRSPSPTPTIDLSYDRSMKIRRRTAQPQDLLFGENKFIY